MAKNLNVTWLGDADPMQQVITEGGLRFVKGEAVKVPAGHSFNGMPWADKLRNNPMFAVDEKADPVESDEAEQPEEEGTEKAALKAELRERGVEVKGNPSLDTLRNKLVAATANENA